MNRILSYKNSIIKFMISLNDYDNINYIINEHINNSSFWISIFCLTIINNNNKKNNCKIHGYYLATCIEFLIILANLTIDKYKMITKYGVDKYHKTILDLSTKCFVMINNHMQMIKCVSYNIYDKLNNVINKITTQHTFNSQNNLDKIMKYNFDKKYENKLKKFNKITNNSYNLYFNNYIFPICEISLDLINLSSDKTIRNINNNIITCFANIVKIIDDCQMLLYDIDNNDNFTTNYVLNYGLEDSFNLYTLSKQVFIHFCLENNCFTNTISDIFKNMDSIIDYHIESSNIDLKSEL